MALQLVLGCVLGGIAALLLLLRAFAADVYDVVIVWMTARWYAAVFGRLRDGDRVFDIGIGTATALAKNKDELLKRRLSVIGIDYEEAYVRKAEAVLRAAGLWQPAPEGTKGYRPGEFFCRVLQRSIYDSGLEALCFEESDQRGDKGDVVPEALRFDAAYFSGSLTLMPDPVAALRSVVPVLKSDSGRIFITQTFQKSRSPIMASVKPLLKYVTTIDFGQLTTEDDLERILKGAEDVLETVENAPIAGSLDTPFQTARLVVMRIKSKTKTATD